ncbi:MAG: DUF3857 domain-containing protein [Planctomycetota bacterium]
MPTRSRRRGAYALLVVALLLLSPLPRAFAQEASGTQTATFAAGLDALAEAAADDDIPRMIDLVRASLDDAAARWAAGAPIDPDEADGLEVELAFAFHSAGASSSSGIWERALEGLEVPPAAAALHARVQRLRGDARPLHPLENWELVGPFDNERGRGMSRRTEAERSPNEASYEGKVRAVSWRSIPAPGIDGEIFVRNLVHPADQCCVVARTWIRADEDREAVVLLGFGEEGRAWWNGEPVLSALGLHRFAPDSHGVRVTLQSGWNELALKVGGQEDQPAFTARLVDPIDGTPLDLVDTGSAPEGVEPLELTRPSKRSKNERAVPPPGARARLEGAEDSRRLLGLAILLDRDQAAARKDRPGHAEAAAALDADPDSLGAAIVSIGTMRVRGASEVEEDVNPWLGELQAALERHGDRTLLLRAWAGHARSGQGLVQRALDLTERALAANPGSVRARMDIAGDLRSLGQIGLAESVARDLADDPATLRWGAVSQRLADWFSGADVWRTRLLEASEATGLESAKRKLALERSIRSEEAEIEAVHRVAGSILARHPYAQPTRSWAGERLLALGETEAALALFDEALEFCPEDPSLHSWRARALLVTGDVQGAIGALDRACEFDRSATDELRLLEHLRGTTAEDAPAVASFHDRFVEPLDAIVERHPADGAAADAPREILMQRMVVDVGADGRARRYRRTVERVLTDAGARELDVRRFRAYPGWEDVRVLSAVVRHSDGSIEKAPTGRAFRGGVSIDLPPLEPGDVVDLQWRRDDLRTSIFGDYFGLDAAFTPDARLPVRESIITVLAEPEVDLSHYVTGTGADDLAIESSETTREDGTVETTWLVRDLVPTRREAFEPPSAERTPRVQASTYATWDEFGRWWWSLIREEIRTSPEMSAKVDELVADAETPLDRLRAIYDFVVTEVRYNAWEFGIHGYQPYSAPVIFSRRFGDCKDKAILLRAMLGEAGIEAWPVVILSADRRYEEDHALPMIGHFNHCIAHIPAQEGIPEMFLDGTARLHPLEVLPGSDAGARVVIVRDDGVEETRVPFPSAEANLARERITIDMRAPDEPEVELVLEPRGRWDAQQRWQFDGDDKAREDAVERLLTQRFGALRSQPSAEHPDYEDLGSPLRIAFDAGLESVGRKTVAGRELPTAFGPLGLVGSVASETERTTDVLLDVPWSREIELVYELPEGARVGALPAHVSISTEDVEYTRVIETSGEPVERVTVRERFALLTHRVPAERYAEFRAAARRIDEAQRAVIDVEVAQ